MTLRRKTSAAPPRIAERARGFASLVTALPGSASGRAIGAVVLLALGAGACRQDMHDAPRIEAYEANAFFADGRGSRTPPTGTVARGWLRQDEVLYTGRANGELVNEFPFQITTEDMARGRERYNIYCSPCHGVLGDGQGMVVQRGLRRAASYHQDRLREERIGYFFDVVTNGFGAMQGYADQVPVRDRWLIVAYVRALQLSQHATMAEVPREQQQPLMNAPEQGAPPVANPPPAPERPTPPAAAPSGAAAPPARR
jgi:mono/diheme cytochrome c family protein